MDHMVMIEKGKIENGKEVNGKTIAYGPLTKGQCKKIIDREFIPIPGEYVKVHSCELKSYNIWERAR